MAKPKDTTVLKGTLTAPGDWAVLNVPAALCRGLFASLPKESGAEYPPAFGDRKQYNAHISVMRPDEIEEAGGKNAIKEIGQEFSYQLGPVQVTNPAGWDEMEKVWFVKVTSPELETLRKKYGLSAKPNKGKFNFHLTFAVKKKVSRAKKAAAELLSHVMLTGPPGAGKTTAAPGLAKELKLPNLQLDHLPSEEDSRFAGTDTLRAKMRRLRKPKLLEGSSILGLQPDELKNHRVILMDANRDELIRRVMNRGFTDTVGGEHQGPESEEAVTKMVDWFRDRVSEFKKKAPHAEIRMSPMKKEAIKAACDLLKLGWAKTATGWDDDWGIYERDPYFFLGNPELSPKKDETEEQQYVRALSSAISGNPNSDFRVFASHPTLGDFSGKPLELKHGATPEQIQLAAKLMLDPESDVWGMGKSMNSNLSKKSGSHLPSKAWLKKSAETLLKLGSSMGAVDPQKGETPMTTPVPAIPKSLNNKDEPVLTPQQEKSELVNPSQGLQGTRSPSPFRAPAISAAHSLLGSLK